MKIEWLAEINLNRMEKFSFDSKVTQKIITTTNLHHKEWNDEILPYMWKCDTCGNVIKKKYTHWKRHKCYYVVLSQ